MNNFCVDGSVTNPKCYTVNDYVSNFSSGEQIFDTILDVLKSTLPGNLRLIKDCQDNPIVIEEANISLHPTPEVARFKIVVNPLGYIPTYPESKAYRELEYNIEIVMTVGNEVLECVTWELDRFNNAVENLLTSVELLIDGYGSVYLEPKGFNYLPLGQDSNGYFRQGTNRFSVTVTQYKIN